MPTSIKFSLVAASLFFYAGSATKGQEVVSWSHVSTETKELPHAEVGWQTSLLVFDVDKDGNTDIAVAGWGNRDESPVGDDERMIWLRHDGDRWTRYLIDNRNSHVEAGGRAYDIDKDGDLDILQGGSWNTNEVWWWENPYPDYDPSTPWPRYTIKDFGAKQHHDQIFGDFDNDGEDELVFWNQRAMKLVMSDIPADPKNKYAWKFNEVWSWDYPKALHEGLDKADLNQDGLLDIVGGGYWFEQLSGGGFDPHLIDDRPRTRSLVGDFVEGGRPEVIINSGDDPRPLSMYQWNEETSSWDRKDLLDNIRAGHTLQAGDINQDGHLDILSAEMYFRRFNEPNATAYQHVLYGDGKGGFVTQVISDRIGSHEGKLADIDSDGDLDIIGKDFQKEDRLDIWLNQGTSSGEDNAEDEAAKASDAGAP